MASRPGEANYGKALRGSMTEGTRRLSKRLIPAVWAEIRALWETNYFGRAIRSIRRQDTHASGTFEKHGIETSDSKGAFIGDACAVYSNKGKSAE